MNLNRRGGPRKNDYDFVGLWKAERYPVHRSDVIVTDGFTAISR